MLLLIVICFPCTCCRTAGIFSSIASVSWFDIQQNLLWLTVRWTFKFAVWFDIQAFLFYNHCIKRTLKAGSGSSGRLSTAGLTVEMICSPCATSALKTLIAEGRKKEKLLLAQVCGIVWSQPYHSASPSALARSPARFCTSLSSCKLRLQRPNQRLRPVVYLGPNAGFICF